MTTADRFLSQYRTYEQLLRAKNMDPKAVEDGENGTDSERLRMCRQFRNYMSHVQDPGFVEPTEKMLKFLSSRVDALQAEGDIVKKHLKKPDVCMLRSTDKMQEAFDRFNRLKCFGLLVLDPDGKYGLLSVFSAIGAKGTSKVGTMSYKPVKPQFCCPMDDFSSLDDTKVWLCTDTGKPDGKLLGRVWFPGLC